MLLDRDGGMEHPMTVRQTVFFLLMASALYLGFGVWASVCVD
jgi:hypothetical protein